MARKIFYCILLIKVPEKRKFSLPDALGWKLVPCAAFLLRTVLDLFTVSVTNFYNKILKAK